MRTRSWRHLWYVIVPLIVMALGLREPQEDLFLQLDEAIADALEPTITDVRVSASPIIVRVGRASDSKWAGRAVAAVRRRYPSRVSPPAPLADTLHALELTIGAIRQSRGKAVVVIELSQCSAKPGEGPVPNEQYFAFWASTTEYHFRRSLPWWIWVPRWGPSHGWELEENRRWMHVDGECTPAVPMPAG